MLALDVNDEFAFDLEAYFNTIGYVPHPGQMKVHASGARFRVVVAGRRWGKSLMAAREIEPVIMIPGKRVWVVAPYYDLADKVFREVWDSLIVKERLPAVRKSERELTVKFLWGATLEGKSADNPDSLVGEGLDLLVVDEAAKMKREVWEKYLRPTLTDRQGSALFISTPEGYNWFHDLYLRGTNGSTPEWESFHSPSWENPHLKGEEIEEARRFLPPESFAQEFGAQFTTFAGRVYSEFDRLLHVVEPFEIPYGWRRVRGIDFGYRNPFVCLFLTVDGDENIYIYDEHYERGRLIEHHAAQIGRRPGHFEGTYCDPSGRQLMEEIRAKGIEIVPADNSLRLGIQAVKEKLKVRGDGRPSLFVFSHCTNTIREFEGYRFAEGEGGMASEDPLKADDHAMDALRYAVMGLRKSRAAEASADPEPAWYSGGRRSLWRD